MGAGGGAAAIAQAIVDLVPSGEARA